jgi:FKBP-type peptidyl-prolyl cis-trans isomerase SlyD
MIKSGKVVDLSYSLKDSNGQVLDRADPGAPFTYLHGAGPIVPGLENALDGLKAGDKKAVTVSPEEGYGKRRAELRLVVKRTEFPAGVQLETGMQFEAHAPDGRPVVFTIEKLEGDKVHIDGNHPLAGETLHFEVEVLQVRDATKEEMQHGHAHGPDGHHH